MKMIKNIKKGMLFAMVVLISTTAFAQHRHYCHVHHYGCYHPIVTTVVTRPAVTTRISNRLSKQDRLDMALAYLKNNPSLTISKYSNMTGLTKAIAEAELDVFAANKKNPIRMVVSGKRKYYVLA